MAQTEQDRNLNFWDRLGGDRVVWIITLCLCLLSIVALSSATSLLASEGNTRLDIMKGQLLFVGIGLFLVWGIGKIPWLGLFKAVSMLGFVFSASLALLLFILPDSGFIHAGRFNGATRAIVIGGFQFHVFEAIKVAMVMYLAWAIDAFRGGRFTITRLLSRHHAFEFLEKEFWQEVFYIFGPTLIIVALVLPGGNSNALFTAGVLFLTILVGQIRFRDIVITGMVCLMMLGACYGLYKVSGGKILQRIGTLESRLSGKVDYERMLLDSPKGSADYYKAIDRLRQEYGAKIAIKEGGFLLKKGPGGSTQKYVVPVMYEDFIFSFLIEEYGLVMGIILMIFYVSLLARGSLMVRNCDDIYAKITVGGLCLLITAQAMMHIAINCDIGLLTGQTLPLVSYGKSSLVCFCIALGVIQSLSKISAAAIKKEADDSEPLMSIIPEDCDPVKDGLNDLDEYEDSL